MSSLSGKRGLSQSVPFLFSCSLSQFRGPDYHGASNTRAKLRPGVNLIKLLLEFWHQSCDVISRQKPLKSKKWNQQNMSNKKLCHPAKFQIKRIKIVREFFPGHFSCFFFFSRLQRASVAVRFQTLNMYTRKFDPSPSYYNTYRDFDRVTWKTFFGYSI